MEKIIDENGEVHMVSENEINRSILVDRLQYFADKEQDSDERSLLHELASWAEQVAFA